MDPIEEVAARIVSGLSPNVPPNWWPRIRGLISEQDEERYWERLRATYRRRRPAE
jgi:hypothetical protein